ncbi:hypothetical protein NLJ89_g4384 [Agrocybe chaxingu]|uniref:Uncharacterized protein n=1 Tax=Agrocybe chaxingu TaxID=84603 RepID=A0A9W8K373_9AGAR|nr:hypothetical protein NLJ89_g4384 [Agrocybe chaxingu]
MSLCFMDLPTTHTAEEEPEIKWYGSGFYDSNDTPGVFGRNFTFVFWPIAWPVAFVPFLLAPELGPASNANRPGGVLMSLQIPSSKGSDMFRVVSDEFTVDSLSDSVQDNCKDLIGTLSSAVNISDTVPQSFPQAEQVLYYYRASSVALTWDSLNDTAAMLQNYTVASAPGPSVDTDAYKLVECLNRTIVDTVPLFDSAFMKYQAPGGMTLALILLIMHLLR